MPFQPGHDPAEGEGGRQRRTGRVAAMLKSNPQLSAERKAEVQKLMADVLTTLGDQNGFKEQGARRAQVECESNVRR